MSIGSNKSELAVVSGGAEGDTLPGICKPVRIGLEGPFDYEYDKGALSCNERNIEPEDWPRAVMCGRVRGSIYVSPQGKVLPCMTFMGTPMEEKFPNMLETPLPERERGGFGHINRRKQIWMN